MPVTSPLSAMTGPDAAAAEVSPRIEDAARQFEALLITQLLRAARADASGWLGAGDDQSASPAVEMAEEQLAASLSAQGGLGLARLIVGGLKTE